MCTVREKDALKAAICFEKGQLGSLTVHGLSLRFVECIPNVSPLFGKFENFSQNRKKFEN